MDAPPAAAAGRILILCTMTSPSGAPIAALRLAAGLAGRGWSVSAAFLYHREAMEGVDHDYACLLDRPPRSPLDHLRMLGRLFAMIRRERPDVVLGFLPLAMLCVTVAARLCGVKARVVSHRVPVSTYGAVMRRLDRLAAWSGCYTDVISVSRGVAASCGGYPAWLRARMVVIYNGLKGWRRSPMAKPEARALFDLPGDAFVIAAVGRLELQKNYPLLIAAMADAPAHCLLAVAGSGGLRDEIMADIAARGLDGRVRLLGALQREAVPHLLAAADVFAQPSLFEGQSNALLEALSAGLPCLVSDVPEQVETVTGADGAVAGAVLPLGDPAAWGRAIGDFAARGDSFAAAQAATASQAGLFTFDRMMTGFATALGAARMRRRG